MEILPLYPPPLVKEGEGYFFEGEVPFKLVLRYN